MGNIYNKIRFMTEDTPNYQEIFNKFKLLFDLVIKNDLLRVSQGVYSDVELLDDYDINDHTGKVYVKFIVYIPKEEFQLQRRTYQELTQKLIVASLYKFNPNIRVNVLSANIKIETI